MKDSAFWEIVDLANELFIYEEARNYELYDRALKENFQIVQPDQLMEFQETLNQMLSDLFQPKIIEIYYLTNYGLGDSWGYISNDGFLDFRAWIVSLGKKNFQKFMHFQDEDEIFGFDLDPNTAYRDDLVYFGKWTCKKLYGDENHLCEMKVLAGWDGFSKELSSEMKFDKQALQRKYSKLINKYQK